ncbi:MAG: hypothetical protein IPO88_33475 [Nannocystis sp.]|uniref:hypothetical protein n=1 Tax=Nannocystis sp. TaxID=1962667 RepID=UPI0024297CAB|nr:hypothetical protein [Nannocystis sp.]MBK9758344.1 hypothetical protein [Nannocystis sp.]
MSMPLSTVSEAAYFSKNCWFDMRYAALPGSSPSEASSMGIGAYFSLPALAGAS